ncbi:hypothetical protein bcgnr5378_13550 [Bacillus cereus]|uniref:hypothetical protein n=1 Tax=Bacillus TaxID=1386 RepID=UPI000789D270|nr:MULTISPECIES: hypothetical protein [Bacillus]AYF04904.1 hypothetical protein MLA2C4_04125 [Bacillus mobilis]HDR4562009.1 hypothetical protein [Bacillus luti]KYQ03137.1 hypothetical protein B4079_1617 [Bacillus cereus]MCT1379962.1 hypothetical protein [Bacillus sp. p3-SID196]MCU5470256.1 hypothetical protein [Bacillus paranthracis]
MGIEEKIELLKKHFLSARASGNYETNFTIISGGNAVILKSNNQNLQSFCIKCPIDASLQPYVIQTKTERNQFDGLCEETLEILKEVYSPENFVEKSIIGDIKNYIEITKHSELTRHVPKFYYPTIQQDDWENADFIIMDYIDGEFHMIQTLYDCSPEEKFKDNKFQNVYCLFKEKGFEFGDNFECIVEKTSKRVVMIDLDGIHKL